VSQLSVYWLLLFTSLLLFASQANNLTIVGAPVYESSTRMIVTPSLLEDAVKMQMVKRLEAMLQGVLAARSRIMVECNCPSECLAAVVAAMPCMKRPTISPLYADAAEATGGLATPAKDFALKGAVPRKLLMEVMQNLSAAGATDILVTEPSLLLS
jgi:ATP phosphoribosyltransferase